MPVFRKIGITLIEIIRSDGTELGVAAAVQSLKERAGLSGNAG